MLGTIGDPSTGDTGCSSHGIVAACVPEAQHVAVLPTCEAAGSRLEGSRQGSAAEPGSWTPY